MGQASVDYQLCRGRLLADARIQALIPGRVCCRYNIIFKHVGVRVQMGNLQAVRDSERLECSHCPVGELVRI